MNWTTKVSPLVKELELRHNPVIIRVNKFDEDSASEFAQKMAMAHNTGQPVIPIIIDSYGGQVYSLMSMITAIKNSEIPVATIVEGKAMSCGVILFSCGEDGMRFISEEATLMIHDVSSGAFGKNEEIQASAKETKRLNKRIYEILSDNCKKPRDYFWKEVQRRGRADWFVTPKKAKKMGIADHVGVPKLNIDVRVDIELRMRDKDDG
jgi:ATP-dependent Clp endopeptidase proteolytic subunit ClpP